MTGIIFELFGLACDIPNTIKNSKRLKTIKKDIVDYKQGIQFPKYDYNWEKIEDKTIDPEEKEHLKELQELEKIEIGCWIDLVKPTEKEMAYVIKETGVDETLLKYALDEEETSHIDTEEDQILISINMPITEKNKRGKLYTTMPLGILVVRDDYVITISSEKFSLMDMLGRKKTIVGEIATYKKSRLAFQLIYITSVEFLRYLTYISRDMETFEDNLTKTMSNKELLKLINYQKSMIFFNTALKTNQAVMERLRRGKFIKLYEEAHLQQEIGV